MIISKFHPTNFSCIQLVYVFDQKAQAIKIKRISSVESQKSQSEMLLYHIHFNKQHNSKLLYFIRPRF